MKYLIIFTCILCSCQISGAKKEFYYEVEAKNGGPNGFNHSVCKCNTLSQQFNSKYSEPGYEKYQNCCEDDLPKEAIKLIKICDKLISEDKDTSGVSKMSGYNLTFDIKNKNNFTYSISK